MPEVSDLDKEIHKKMRQNISNFMQQCGQKYDNNGLTILDIAPQDHEGASPYFPNASIKTMDIDAESGADYIADLCTNNSATIPSESFDIVVCTEVLEHTLQPFNAVAEIRRILKKGGLALVSTPFDFRIHGPLPDCWRFTEHGLRELFKDFELIELKGLEQADRFLMPFHYTLIAKNSR